MDEIAKALEPYGYYYPISVTSISGPGSLIVIFAGLGDLYVACLTHDYQVVWIMTCGGQEVDASVEDINELHAETRSFYLINKGASQ